MDVIHQFILIRTYEPFFGLDLAKTIYFHLVCTYVPFEVLKYT